jgi:hypothetical protein
MTTPEPPAGLERQLAALVARHVPDAPVSLAAELATVVRDITTPLADELARLQRELAQHATCATCGHERHEHQQEPVLRRTWCSGCTTANDLHDFKEPS